MALMLILRPSGITGGREFKLWPRAAHDARLRRRRRRDRQPLRRAPRACRRGLGARPPRRARPRAARSSGLRVSGRADFTAQLQAATAPEELPEPELVILACKTLDLDAVAGRIAGHWPDAIVMTVQNGIGADEVVARHGDWRHPQRGHVHERHAALGHARAVRPRHRDVDRAGARHDSGRCARGRGSDRELGAEGRGVRRPAPGAVVEADLQRDRQHRRRADRAAARRALRRRQCAVEPREPRPCPDRRGKGRRAGGRRAAQGGSMGDERPRHPARQRPLPLDARGRRGAPAHRGRHDHGSARARGRPARRARPAAQDDGTADQGQGGELGQ